MFCLAPLLFLGYAQTIQTDWHTSKNISAPYVEAQTCQEGLGARIAGSYEWVQIGPQYGFTLPISQSWSIIGQIHGGWGYSNTIHPETGVRQVTKWNGGVSFMVQYHHISWKIGYDHMSNGRGSDPTNHGQDMITTGIGYTF